MTNNTSIIVCDQKYDIGTPVVLWTDPNGFSAYDTTRYETEDRKTGKIEVIKGKRYKSRLTLGGTPDLEKLKKVCYQFALHHSGLYRAKDTYDTLQQRGLSVHFILDDDPEGTIYQTIDARERAYHIGLGNAMSIGIEICSRAAAGQYPDAYDEAHQRKYNVGPRRKVPDVIHGMKLLGYDYTDAQYAALIKLAKGLVNIFPLIRPDFARDLDGKIIKTVLSDPTNYKGFITHFQYTLKKIDPVSFDFNRFLTGVNGSFDPIIKPINTKPTFSLVDWQGRQTALKLLGYNVGIIDGVFGPKTKAALQLFQTDKGLVPDGIWGPKTAAALQQTLEQK